MPKRFIILVLCLTTCYLYLFSCKKDFYPQDTKTVHLTAEYVEVTEAWLKLSVDPLVSKCVYTVKRDTHTVFESKMNKADIIIHDTGLEPATDYEYKVEVNQQIKKSTILQITTMDTTSHNFNIEKYEFGAKSSSYFMDAAIISPTNIYAVGQIYTEDTYTYDSLGNWINPYNAAHWDGEKWELIRIPFKMCSGTGTGSTIYPRIGGVYFFDTKIGVFIRGGSVSKKEGTEYYSDCNMNAQLKGAMQHIWGLSENEYYISGSKSASGTDNTLLTYKNGKWTHLDVPTEIDINDVWGTIDEESGQPYILVPLSYKFQLGEKKLLRLKPDNSFTEENWPFPNNRIGSVWFKDKQRIFTCGGGVFTRNKYKQWKEFKELPSIYTDGIRGNDINDIFVAGDCGILAHFNGITWKQYTEFYEVNIFRSIAFKDDIAVAVGEKNSRAVVYIIRREH